MVIAEIHAVLHGDGKIEIKASKEGKIVVLGLLEVARMQIEDDIRATENGKKLVTNVPLTITRPG